MMIEICEHCAERLREKLTLLHPDIDAAAERARIAFHNCKGNYADWKAVARAVYGLTSEGG